MTEEVPYLALEPCPYFHDLEVGPAAAHHFESCACECGWCDVTILNVMFGRKHVEPLSDWAVKAAFVRMLVTVESRSKR